MLRVEVAVGARVEAETPLLTLESMKMEIPVLAEKHGVVARILVTEKEPVTEGQTLLELEV